MPRGCEALTWLKYGQDEIPASLGITVGSEAQVSTQWRRLFKSVGDECAETLTHLKRELGPTARASLIWGAFVSKLPYMAGVQVPKQANEIMATAQARLNEAMLGGRPGGALRGLGRAYVYMY